MIDHAINLLTTRLNDYPRRNASVTYDIARASNLVEQSGSVVPENDNKLSAGDKKYVLTQSSGRYLLYCCMLLSFQNGGGPCDIVWVGKHGNAVDADRLMGGIEPLVKEQEPTMVVVPDAMLKQLHSGAAGDVEVLRRGHKEPRGDSRRP